jgi:hypothetical protein
VGGVTGVIVGGIADQQQPEFRSYVTTQKAPSYTYKEEVRVGAVLPESGVTYHEVPAQCKSEGLQVHGGEQHPRASGAEQPQDRAGYPVKLSNPKAKWRAALRSPVLFYGCSV